MLFILVDVTRVKGAWHNNSPVAAVALIYSHNDKNNIRVRYAFPLRPLNSPLIKFCMIFEHKQQ